MHLRVLYIVTAYNRHQDDVITPWLVETVRRLAQVGIAVEILAPSYRGMGEGTIEGVRVHRFRYAPSRWEDLTHDQTAPDRVRQYPWYLALVPGYVLSGMRASSRLVRRQHFDVVHVHWPLPHALQGLVARRAAGTPLVLSFHGVELTWARQFPAFRPFLRYAIRSADAVTANSNYTAGMIKKLHDRPIQRIPFGATVEAVAVPGSIEARGKGSYELLFVGRLVERKGVHYLLDAVERLRASHDVFLRIVGDGPWRAKLEAQVTRYGLGDRVEFAGFVAATELAESFARADAFVLPAIVDSKGDTEGLGVVLVEAMCNEKPVIATAVGGIPDVVKDGATGVLVPPADAGALAEAIAGVIEEPQRARASAKAGRKHVEAEFSWPVITERLASLYQRLSSSVNGQSGQDA